MNKTIQNRLYVSALLMISVVYLLQGCDDEAAQEEMLEEISADICIDGVDNDDDGAVDCEDAGCFAVCLAKYDEYTGPRPAHNGRRGKIFNSGWRFHLGDAKGAHVEAFNDADWRNLDLPHDWSIELPYNNLSVGGAGNGYLDGGIGWYRKTFSIPAFASFRRVLVQFDGVYMNSEVWINGHYLGIRPYGYSSFEYDLTPYIRFGGSNTIAVRVDNNQPNSRWYSGSGIYRNVWLTELEPVHIPNSSVVVTSSAVSDASATVQVAISAVNQSRQNSTVIATTTIVDENDVVVATADSDPVSVPVNGTSAFAQTLTVASPRLWSVNAPTLYQVSVELKEGEKIVDTYLVNWGFRTPAFDPNTGFSLNGIPMKLQGVNMHHDLGALGAAVNVRAMERQVEILKGMGVNAIRISHNPPAPEYLDVCDRLGMLVMDEAFDTWQKPKNDNDYALYFDEWAKRDIQDMVRRDRNHPSVFAWSIGNEIYSAKLETAQNLIGWVKEEDTTRPLTWASNQMERDRIHPQIADLLDLQGYNYAGYAGDYDGDHEANPHWNIYGSETAAAVRSRGIYHTPARDIIKTNDGTSSDKQCSSYDNEAARFGESAQDAYWIDQSRPFVAGSFVWSGFDYIGEPTPYHYYPSKSSYFGIVDTAGFPKDVYYFYKSRWTKAPMVHLLPHWNWSQEETVTIFAYTNCNSVELFLNGESQGMEKVTEDTLRLEWDVPWEAGELRAECIVNGSVVVEDKRITAGPPAKVVLAADRQSITADGRDLAFITADILDADGHFVATADTEVSFTISGPGRIVATDAGNPRDVVPYQESTRQAFSGKVLAIVTSAGEPGQITVNAHAASLETGAVMVTAE